MGTIEKYMPRCRIFLLDGEKFRTNLLVLFFELPLKQETATKTALLAEILRRGCERYPTPQALAKQTENLYGAVWDVSVVKKGDRQLLLFSMETLKAVDLEESISFLKELILYPLQKKGGFPQEVLERQKKILKKKLQGLQDDKKVFARKRALEETARGTAWAISADGQEEDLEEIDGKNLYAYYQSILKEAKVHVFFCGDKNEKEKIIALRKEFKGTVPVTETEEEWENREAPRFILEWTRTEQARLVLGFSADIGSERKQATLLLLHRFLGGDPDSVLFQKVREEKGLCYHIRSYTVPLSPYLFVEAGIRERDGKETGKLVLKCIEELRKNPVSEEKLRQKKEAIKREFADLEDQPWTMTDYFAEQVLQGKRLTLDTFLRQIERIEAEDLKKAAEKLELQAVYMLSGEEEERE